MDTDDDQGFRGKSVLITGGTAGVGLSVAEHLARRGATVALSGRSRARGEQASARIQALSPRSFFCRATPETGAARLHA